MGLQPEGERKNDMRRPVFPGINSILYFPGPVFIHRDVLGASVRHSAHGKGHKEGGLTYAKAGSSLRSPLEILEHLPP